MAFEAGIDAGVLCRWVRRQEAGQSSAASKEVARTTPNPEAQTLRRELNRVKMERRIFKKSVRLSRTLTRVKYEFIAAPTPMTDTSLARAAEYFTQRFLRIARPTAQCTWYRERLG